MTEKSPYFITKRKMKKTQKILDSLKYIDNKDMSNEELERLVEEIYLLIN